MNLHVTGFSALLVGTTVALLASTIAFPAPSEEISLTLTEGTNFTAVASPDRQSIAIDVLGMIWVLAIDGGPARRITPEMLEARNPAWGPDSKSLTFQAFDEDNWHIYGLGLHVELEQFVKSGLSPSQALQTATRNAAEALGVLDELGTIERGKLADLVIIDANPLEDIRATRDVRGVMRGGWYYDLAALGVRP